MLSGHLILGLNWLIMIRWLIIIPQFGWHWFKAWGALISFSFPLSSDLRSSGSKFTPSHLHLMSFPYKVKLFLGFHRWTIELWLSWVFERFLRCRFKTFIFHRFGSFFVCFLRFFFLLSRVDVVIWFSLTMKLDELPLIWELTLHYLCCWSLLGLVELISWCLQMG